MTPRAFCFLTFFDRNALTLSKLKVLSGIISVSFKIRVQKVCADRLNFEQVHWRIQFLKCCKRDFLCRRMSIVLI